MDSSTWALWYHNSLGSVLMLVGIAFIFWGWTVLVGADRKDLWYKSPAAVVLSIAGAYLVFQSVMEINGAHLTRYLAEHLYYH